jgi:FkbM family methyltransferase
MKNIYNCKYYLFEATDYPELTQFNNDHNINVCRAILNDRIEEVYWYQKNGTGDSFFKELGKHYTNCDPVKKTTIDLDTYILQNNILHESKNIFIKIDCQGAEIPILKGAASILNRTDFILLEIPLFGEYNLNVPNFLEHIKFMDSIGFIIYDIIEEHYVNDFNMQIDILFINKNHNFNTLVNESQL